MFYSFQNIGTNKIRTVKISNLPNNIEKIRIHFPTDPTSENLIDSGSIPKLFKVDIIR